MTTFELIGRLDVAILTAMLIVAFVTAAVILAYKFVSKLEAEKTEKVAKTIRIEVEHYCDHLLDKTEEKIKNLPSIMKEMWKTDEKEGG